MEQTPATHTHIANDDRDYDVFLSRILARFVLNTENGKLPLFATAYTGNPTLFNAYLSGLPEENRKYHDCNACRQFVNTFGSLVVIDAKGDLVPAFWNPDDAPDYYRPGVVSLVVHLEAAKVTGLFRSSAGVWGRPTTRADNAPGGVWTHFGFRVPSPCVHDGRVKSASEFCAEKAEDLKNVRRALHEYEEQHLVAAVELLKSDVLARSEAALGPAQWLLEMHRLIKDKELTRWTRDNLFWCKIAMAPSGFCHPRSSILGTLLDDLAAGKSVDQIMRSFGLKVAPGKYLRPVTAPTDGAIKRAETIFEAMNLGPALRRRFARLEEIETIWMPRTLPAPAKKPGLFGDLSPAKKAEVQLDLPEISLTWVKFAAEVLPLAMSIDFCNPYKGSYMAITTAVDPEAPPILLWDREDSRNPFGTYGYVGGSTPGQWGLRSHDWTPLTALTNTPSEWRGRTTPNQGRAILGILQGARDVGEPNLGLFPATLKGELHEVRSVIEAYSQAHKLEGAAEASACGTIICVPGIASHTGTRVSGRGAAARLRVRTESGTSRIYHIDRWD